MTFNILMLSFLLCASNIISSPLPVIDGQLKSFWFNYINSTLNLLKIAANEVSSESKCRQHIQELIDQSMKGERWANQMIDSMGRPDTRILEMSFSYLGSYSECIDSKAPNFSSKYCLANIYFSKSKSDFFKKMTNSKTNLLSKLSVKIGTCVPSTCSEDVIQRIITKISSSLITNSTVTLNKCYEKIDQNFGTDITSIIVICFIVLLIGIVITATILDHMTPNTQISKELLCPEPSPEVSLESQKSFHSYEKNTNSILYKILIAFSFKTNTKKIFDTKCNDNSIQVFHGIKVLAMLWIISVHSFSFANQWMNFRNPSAIREAPQNLMYQLLVNGTFSVDCFYFISGFLVSYILIKEMKKSERNTELIRKVPLLYIHRYFRMTPSMMVIIGFSATLLQYMGSGPQWMESITMFNSWCHKNWWINALYLHNFIKTENMCLSHSWYSAVDMQFYWISPFILMVLYKNGVRGIILTSSLLVISMLITAYLTIDNQFPAVPYFSEVIDQEVVDRYYGWVYIKPYCRIGPYLVGIVLAYFIYTSRGDIKLDEFSRRGWVITILAILLVLFSMFGANNGDIPEVYFAALYSAGSRTIWALCLAWITIACITGNGGFFNDFLSAKIWVPLSRLTYCAYLTHPIIIAIFYGSREQTIDYSSYLLTYFTISHIFITYVFSFIISVTIEFPLINISKVLLSKNR